MTPSHSTKNSVPASHVQMKVAQKNLKSHPVVNQLVVSQTSQMVTNQLVTSQTSHPVVNQLVTSQLVTSQLVVNQLVTSQLVTSHQSSVMTVNGPNAKNPPQLKMVKSNVRRTHVCSNVVMVSWSMDLPRASA